MLWWIGAAWAIDVAEVPNPRAAGSWVSDVAGVLDVDTERRLDARLDALHRDTDVEIAVVTVPDVPTSPKVFATALFNHWGIGDRDADNGVLVLLVLGDRRLEMETGTGMQAALPADWLARMQAEAMVPSFKAGDYGGGLERGLARVDDHLRGAEGSSTLVRDFWIVVGSLVGVGAVGVAGVGGIVAAGLGFHRRERTCGRCGVFMPALSEEEEDAHLDAGQQAEESIRSKDWTVHLCPRCGDVRTFALTRWFSGHTSCPKCAYRTRSTRSSTLTAATTTSTGVQEVEESCAHCGYHAVHTHTIAMLSYADSGSSGWSSDSGGSFDSGGSSDFGGGSSDGGGSGSDW